MRKKLMKTICTFLACILLLNSTVLAVPVENTSAQSTFSSTLTREPISKITDGEIQSSDIEIVKRDVEGTQLLVNCKGVQWYLTYDIESRIAEIKNLSTNESYDFFVDNYYYDDATNKIVDEVYYIGNTSDISKNFYADSFNLDTSDYVRIDLFESDSAIQPMTVITGWRIAQELLEALMAIGLATIIAGTTYVIATEALEYLDQENYDYWRARRSSGRVWIGPGISFATAVILLTDAGDVWAKTPGLAQTACINASPNGVALGPYIHHKGCVGYYYHYHPTVFVIGTGEYKQSSRHCWYYD